MRKEALITSCALILLLFSNSCQDAAGKLKNVSCYEVVVGETVVDNTPSKQLKVNCPAGKKAFGAGWSVLDETSAILEGKATYFEPSYDGSHWLTNAKNESSFASKWKLRVRLICGCKQ